METAVSCPLGRLNFGSVAAPKKVALIACPWIFFDQIEFRSQQLGLGYIGAFASQFGHSIVAFIDPMIGGGENVRATLATKYQTVYRFGFPDEWIVQQIPRDVDVIGINAPFTDSRLVLFPLVKKIKASFPNVPVVVGGVLASTLPRQILEKSPADVAVRGEGEIALARILNGEPLIAIPGLVFRNPNGDIVDSGTRTEQLSSINDIPPPGYNFRPMGDYVSWSPRGNKAERTLSVVSSRGCPFNCAFCSIPEKAQRWRPFTPERVLEEIVTAIDRWGVNHIEFEDDNFTLREDRALKVLEGLRDLRKRGYPIKCSFPNGVMVDKMTPEIAVLMREAGAEVVYLPVESGDPRVLVAMNKNNAEGRLAKTLRVAEDAVKAGLLVSSFFIVGYPGGRVLQKHSLRPEYEPYLIHESEEVFMKGEDEASFERTVEFATQLRALGVGGITPLIATPYPGTAMYSFCERFGCLAYPDEAEVLTTVSYAAMRPDFVQVDSPWCSRERAYGRWRYLMDHFPTFHNVRKAGSDNRLLSGQEINP